MEFQQERQVAEEREAESDRPIAVVNREEQGGRQWGNHAATYSTSPGNNNDQHCPGIWCPADTFSMYKVPPPKKKKNTVSLLALSSSVHLWSRTFMSLLSCLCPACRVIMQADLSVPAFVFFVCLPHPPPMRICWLLFQVPFKLQAYSVLHSILSLVLNVCLYIIEWEYKYFTSHEGCISAVVICFCFSPKSNSLCCDPKKKLPCGAVRQVLLSNDFVIIIIIMKYLLSTNLWYIPELGTLYKKKKKARTVQEQ